MSIQNDCETEHTQPDDVFPEENNKKNRICRIALKIGGVFLVFLFSAAVLLCGAINIICTGPFPTARELFVVSVNETSALKFLSRIYFSEEEVAAILKSNAVLPPDEITNITTPFETRPPIINTPDLEIIDLSGYPFKGKVMIIQDPARVSLATIPKFGPTQSGKKIVQLVKDSGAIAGINAGGFADTGGIGRGGQPLGLLIQDGVILSGSLSTHCNIIGLSNEHRLVVGAMTGKDALDLGVRDAVHFEPTLIVNGIPAEINGTGGGVNPRTCIGQRADGAILFLVIDGRQPHSIGATLQDCLAIMREYGAVNAACLDGGSSSEMVYQGEIINICSSLYGPRAQPSAFVVAPLPESPSTQITEKGDLP